MQNFWFTDPCLAPPFFNEARMTILQIWCQLCENFLDTLEFPLSSPVCFVRLPAGPACQTRPHPRGSKFKEASDTRLTGVDWTQSTWPPHLALSSAPRFPLANPSVANLSRQCLLWEHPCLTEDTGFSLAAWAKDSRAERRGNGQRVSLWLVRYQLSPSTFFFFAPCRSPQ